MPHQPAISFSISIQKHSNRAGGRTSNVSSKEKTMKYHLSCLLAIISMVSCSTADDGMPFGKVTENDAARLTQFAKDHGVDLGVEGKKAYAKDKKALARIFKLSVTFKTLDQNARTYGQIIYSSLLNLGETMGVEEYSKVIEVQDPEVRQRVRDFLYYPMTRLPQKERAESDKQTRKDYPTLFPKDYQFGQNDPLFKQ
jgi:hypothetical protein